MPATRVGVVKGCDWLRPLLFLLLLLLWPLLLQLLRWLLLLQERCGAPACDAAAERWGSKDQRCALTGAEYNTTTSSTTTQCNTSASQPVCFRTLPCTKSSARTQRCLLECVFWKHAGPESVGPEREIRRRLGLEHGRRIYFRVFARSQRLIWRRPVSGWWVGWCWWVRGCSYVFLYVGFWLGFFRLFPALRSLRQRGIGSAWRIRSSRVDGSTPRPRESIDS